MALQINRRAALFAGLLAAWTIPEVARAEGAVLAWTPTAMSLEEARILAAACERITPATATPGAIAAGAPQFVDRAVAGWCSPDEAHRLRRGLVALEDAARARFGAGFSRLPVARQDELLLAADAEGREAVRRGEPHYFPLLRDLATVGYFQSERGATEALRYDPVPGEYRGCVPLTEIGRGWAL